MLKLIYILNSGCDDITQGIAEMGERELDVFISAIKDLNRNSTYSCMPTIEVWEIDWSDLVECSDYSINELNDLCDYEKLYFGKRLYKPKELFSLAKRTKLV